MIKNIEKIYSLFLECDQSVCTDTRKIIPGSIFFALKGSNFDGNAFALEALQKGCSWAVVDNPDIAQQNNQCILVDNVLHTLQSLAQYHRKHFDIPVIAITGSNGKTTTKELVSAVLSKKYKVLSTPGNFNNHIGLPLTLLKLRKEHEIAVIEMGANHPGEIEELCNIALPNYGIITSIGKEHLEGFGNIETVKKTNGELYDHLLQNNGKIFIHIDNTDLISILEELQQDRSIIFTHNFILYSDWSESIKNYSTIKHASKDIVIGQYLDSNEDIYVHLKWIKINSDILKNIGMENLKQDDIKHSLFENAPIVKTRLLAYHNFINALCAISVGQYFSVTDDAIRAAISEYVPSNNRMQFQKTNRNVVILDAYNANPTSMMAALQFFQHKQLHNNILDTRSEKNFNEQDKVLILGDMFELGEHSEQEHLSIITWILQNFKEGTVYLVGKEFANAFQKTSSSATNIHSYSSTDDFLSILSKHPISNKFILIKGSRGMQLEKTMSYL